MKIRAVFFDAGHTLLLPDYNVYEEILSKYRVRVERDYLLRKEAEARHVYDELILSGRREDAWVIYYSRFLELLGVDKENIPKIIEEVRERNRRGLGIWIKKNDGVDEVLMELKGRGLKLGVISNSDGRVEDILRFNGILKHFDVVLDSGRIGIEKPDERIFHLATDRVKVKPGESLYVGDYYSVDYLGAQKAGLIPVLYDPLDVYREFDCIRIRNLLDIVKMVDRICSPS
jgi:putative hydrolase of the HAD superfamily